MELKINYIGIDIDGKDIKVQTYLPMKEKIAAGLISVNGAVTDNGSTFNDAAFEAILLYQLVDHYSNVMEVFPELSKDFGILESYDILETNGVIKAIIDVVSEENPGEIDSFVKYAESLKEDFKKEFNGMARLVTEGLDALLTMVDMEDLKQIMPANN